MISHRCGAATFPAGMGGPLVVSSGSCSVLVKEVVDLLRGRLAHDGLQLTEGGIAQLLHTGEVLQKSQGLDPADPRHLLHHSQDQRVQQLAGSPSAERVLLALTVDLWWTTEAATTSTVSDSWDSPVNVVASDKASDN